MELLIQGLGDKRLDNALSLMMNRVMERLSLIVRRLSNCRSEEVKFGRLLRNPEVTQMDIINASLKLVSDHCEDRHVLLIQDTSEISFGYEPFQKGLGPVGNGESSGFMLHPVIAMDAQEGLCLGLAGLEIFKRVHCEGDRNKVAFEKKHSYRWLSSIKTAKDNCIGAKGYTVVSDREGDIYDALHGYLDADLDFVVRSWHNRPMPKGSSADRLWDLIDLWPVQGQYECMLPATDKRNAHFAKFEIKFGKVELLRPERSVSSHLPRQISAYIVEVMESHDTVIKGQQAVLWRLITSHQITDLEAAILVIQFYIRRWNIEQVFRLLKSQGLNLANSLSQTYENLSKLAVIGLIAAVRVLQLVTARNNPQCGLSDMAFDVEEVKMLESINPILEGNTQIQKNPHPKKSLAFAAWVVARLGGWKGYSKSERPPGPITMMNGLKQFQAIMDASKFRSILADTS